MSVGAPVTRLKKTPYPNPNFVAAAAFLAALLAQLFPKQLVRTLRKCFALTKRNPRVVAAAVFLAAMLAQLLQDVLVRHRRECPCSHQVQNKLGIYCCFPGYSAGTTGSKTACTRLAGMCCSHQTQSTRCGCCCFFAICWHNCFKRCLYEIGGNDLVLTRCNPSIVAAAVFLAIC